MAGDIQVAMFAMAVLHRPLLGLLPFDNLPCVGTPFSLQARTDLENHSVDAATTSEAVVFITLLQGLKRNMRTWELSVEVCNVH